MVIESLNLDNFRNYRELTLELHPGVNLFYGDNAQGKTNILEAVYLAGTTKSHRGSKEKTMVMVGEEESHIRMVVRKRETDYRIDMHLRRNRPKGVAIGGFPIRKASELYGLVNLVFFSPEDLTIIKEGPAERRRFLDSELSQLNRSYLESLIRYHRALNQRNRLLKDAAFRAVDEAEFDVWEEQLAACGQELIASRRSFLADLQSITKTIHKTLTGGSENLELVYEPSASEEILLEKLRANRRTDLHQMATTTGPHRDDFGVFVNGLDARFYASQGQQKTAALSLKLSEIELVKEKTNDTPILLLDDVLSELDTDRQNYLLNSIHEIQALITCTGIEEVTRMNFPVDRAFHVVAGGIE